MDTDTLTAPAAKAHAAYTSRRLRTGVAKFALGQADSRKQVPFLIAHHSVI